MSMSYCRWRNALHDVRAGLEAFYNGSSIDMDDEEKTAMRLLVQEIADLIDSEGGQVDLGYVKQSINNGVCSDYEPEEDEDNWTESDLHRLHTHEVDNHDL